MKPSTPVWRLVGEYFENCNCNVVCPCLMSSGKPLTASPTRGACEVFCGFHIDTGNYGDVSLDDLNAATAYRSPGPMGEGNWSAAMYLDERANESQRNALEAIFSGSAGGPVALLAPLISTVLGVKSVPMIWRLEGKRRALEIPGILNAAVTAIPTWDPEQHQEIWAVNAHPFAAQIAMAVGDTASTWKDYGMRWDNTGKWGDYASISWSYD